MENILYIEKRDGSVLPFDHTKIVNAIIAAMRATEIIDYEFAINVAKDISKKASEADHIFKVEEIQDVVEDRLMEKYPKVAKKYILYRNERTKVRNMKSDLMKHIKEKVYAANIENANANVDERSFGARKNESAGLLMKEIASSEMLDPEVKKYWEDNLLYIHDMSEYLVGSHNCLNIDIDHMLKNGFDMRNGGIRPANSLFTACQLVAIIMQSISQGQFGGCAVPYIDTILIPYVRKSFLKHFKTGLKYTQKDKKKTYENFEKEYKDYLFSASISAPANIFKNYSTLAYNYAMDMLEKEAKQSTESLIHNLNSLESRPKRYVSHNSWGFHQ